MSAKYNKGDRVFHVDVHQDYYDKRVRVEIEEKIIVEPDFHNKLADPWAYEESPNDVYITSSHDDYLFDSFAEALDYAKFQLEKIKYEGLEK